MSDYIAFLGFSGACSVIAFIAGAGFAYGKLSQRIETMEANLQQATETANEAKTTAAAAHQMVKETMGRIGTLHDDIKADFNAINQSIAGLRTEILDLYKSKK